MWDKGEKRKKTHDFMHLKHAITICDFAILYSNAAEEGKVLCFLHNQYIITFDYISDSVGYGKKT